MRNLSPDMITELTSNSLAPILMAEFEFDSATIRMWTGIGSLFWGDREFLGGGNFLNISSIEETQDLTAKGIVCTLSGVPSASIALALTENVRGRPFRLYLAVAASNSYVELEDGDGYIELEDGSGFVKIENDLVESPYRIFSGLMDVMEFSDSAETATIRLSVENALLIGQRAKMERYTDYDQRKRFPNDKGLEMINQLQDKEITW